jgi:hypothetical protein
MMAMKYPIAYIRTGCGNPGAGKGEGQGTPETDD